MKNLQPETKQQFLKKLIIKYFLKVRCYLFCSFKIKFGRKSFNSYFNYYTWLLEMLKQWKKRILVVLHHLVLAYTIFIFTCSKLKKTSVRFLLTDIIPYKDRIYKQQNPVLPCILRSDYLRKYANLRRFLIINKIKTLKDVNTFFVGKTYMRKSNVTNNLFFKSKYFTSAFWK